LTAKMSDLKARIRRCEAAVFRTGIITALMILLWWLFFGSFYYSAIAGYMLGFISFVALAESYTALDRFSSGLGILAMLGSHMKLLFIAIFIFILHKLGFSVAEIVIGMIFSQMAMIVSFLIILRVDGKNAEIEKKKA